MNNETPQTDEPSPEPAAAHPESDEPEGRALRESMVVSGITGAIGVAFATVASSDAVLLDGAYSLVSFAMAWVAARFTRLIVAPSTEHFPFGMAALEPMVNIARSGIVLVVLAFAGMSAIGDLTSGGAATRAGIAVVYGAVIGGVGIWFAMRQTRRARELGSSILSVDAQSWWADGAISLAVGAGFVVGAVLTWTGVEAPVPYVDPVMVLLLAGWLAREPYAEIRGAFGELLQKAPDVELRERVTNAVEKVTPDEHYVERQVKLWKLGRYLTVRITFLIADAAQSVTYGELDEIRNSIREAIRPIAPVVRVDVLFTADERWLDRGFR